MSRTRPTKGRTAFTTPLSQARRPVSTQARPASARRYTGTLAPSQLRTIRRVMRRPLGLDSTTHATATPAHTSSALAMLRGRLLAPFQRFDTSKTSRSAGVVGTGLVTVAQLRRV